MVQSREVRGRDAPSTSSGQALATAGRMPALLSGLEAISDPRLGHNVARRGGVGFQFLAQLADEDAEIFDLLGALSAPNSA